MSGEKLARLSDVMKTDLVMLAPDTEIVRAVATLLETGVSGALVLDAEGALICVLSKRDCLKAALSASYYKQWGGSVADYMSTEPQTLDADLDLASACEIMIASPFRRFPVTRHGRLVGQVSRTDILRACARNGGRGAKHPHPEPI